MKLINEITPTTQWSAFVAPSSFGSVAAVRPKGGLRPVDVATKADFRAVGNAGMAVGHRPWTPLIT